MPYSNHHNHSSKWKRPPARAYPDNPYGSRRVEGEGPVPCDIMLIGEGPGEEENRTGRPFCGMSGKVMDRMLWAHGIDRASVYVTNVVKYHVPGDARPSAADIARDSHALSEELSRVSPKWIGLIGATAVHVFASDIDLEWAHGIPFKPGFMPIYHPAYGLYLPDQMPLVAYDFQQFALMCRGKIEPTSLVDKYPDPIYVELGDNLDLGQSFCAEHGLAYLTFEPAQKVAIDTEGWWWNPWGLSFCAEPGLAYVIRRSAKRLLRDFADALHRHYCRVILHNSLHDYEVLRALGVDLDGLSVVDTMIQSYLTCLEPQGLKSLARRHCGMQMNDYADIVREAQLIKSYDYLIRLYDFGIKWEKEQERECQSKTSGSASSGSSRTLRKRARSQLTLQAAGQR